MLCLLLCLLTFFAQTVLAQRITVQNATLTLNGSPVFINGANTPWNNWNDFGGSYNSSWWNNEFSHIKNAGGNATRIWITCSGEVGINIDSSGYVSGATQAHWDDLTDMFQLAEANRIYILATLISFDHTKNTYSTYQSWRNMYASSSNIDSFADNYVVPFVNQSAAEVSGDGAIDIIDALLIAQLYVGLIGSLPGCGTVTGETYELQAEDTATWASATVDSDNAGYTGSGFVNTAKESGTWIEWSFDLSESSNATCVFTYASESETRSMDLTVNNSFVTNLTFASTGVWTTWLTKTASVVLNSGSNSIRLTATTSGGAPNMDKLDITISNGSLATPTPTATPVPSQDDVPDGYAGYTGTTGGGNASPVTVSSASAFVSAADNDNPAVIIVNGLLSIGDIDIGSNKTVIGANSSSGLTGGRVRLQGTNCIIRNLTFGPSATDVMEISGATNVFITKCTFHDSSDELCSIVRQADYVTVSWCRFYFNSPDDHSYAHLIGNGDDVTADAGRLHVTLHHNWYDNGVKGRMPRVRYGYVHIYNNYYSSNNTDYCIGAGYQCHIRVENTHFDNVEDPWADYGATTSGGVMGWSNLLFEGTSQPTFISNSYPVFTPPYSFSMDAVNNVESLVRAGAGNVF